MRWLAHGRVDPPLATGAVVLWCCGVVLWRQSLAAGTGRKEKEVAPEADETLLSEAPKLDISRWTEFFSEEELSVRWFWHCPADLLIGSAARTISVGYIYTQHSVRLHRHASIDTRAAMVVVVVVSVVVIVAAMATMLVLVVAVAVMVAASLVVVPY